MALTTHVKVGEIWAAEVIGPYHEHMTFVELDTLQRAAVPAHQHLGSDDGERKSNKAKLRNGHNIKVRIEKIEGGQISCRQVDSSMTTTAEIAAAKRRAAQPAAFASARR
jgi:hypothetical protein